MSTALANYFLGSISSVVQLELLEISHPSFTQTYRKVRNARNGVTVTLENGQQAVFDYLPMNIRSIGSRSDLDTGFNIDFGDLGEVIPKEVDAILASDAMDIKPTVIYRCYRSDDLTAPLVGPLRFEAKSFTFTKEGSNFQAAAPYVNLNRTGQLYSLTVFPMLAGFVR